MAHTIDGRWKVLALVRKKSTGYWHARVRDDRTGKIHEKSTGETARGRAEKARDGLVREIIEREAAGALPTVTFGDLMAILLNDYEVNGKKSMERAEFSVQALSTFFKRGELARDIDGARVQSYIAKRQKAGRATATVNRELAALRRGFTLAIQMGKLASKPYIPALREDNVRQGFFEENDLCAVREKLPEYLQPVAEFEYLTGWRKSEVLSLRWSPQIDFAAGVIRLEPGTTKNDEGRTFPFSALPRLAALLKAQRARVDSMEKDLGRVVPWVFPHDDGSEILDFRNAWKAACEAAGLPGRIPHDFRRTAVRNLERAGVPRSVAMKLTGHKTEAVYRRYAIVSEKDLREGVKKLAKLTS